MTGFYIANASTHKDKQNVTVSKKV